MMARIESLLTLERAIWQELRHAVREPNHEWRTMALATTDGESAQARTVMLREFDEMRRELLFFTDARSPKVGEIAEHPQGTLLLWSRKLHWQLRLAVELRVETEGPHQQRHWARLRDSTAANDYLSPAAPGAVLDRDGISAHGERAYFAVVHAKVLAVDWLELRDEGHRRASFDANGGLWRQP